MPWITPTTEDLTRALTAPENDAVSTVALADGAPDPVPGTLADAVQLTRGYIAACPRNRLGPAGTIPTALLSTLLAVARWNLLTRLPISSLTTEGRRAEYEDAIARLRDTAACRLSVEQPDDIGPEKTASSKPLYRPRLLTRQPDDADGL